MICGEDKTRKILDDAWQAYCSAQSAIDAMEGIGLSVDGASSPGSGDSVARLYGAITSAGNILLRICGVPRPGTLADEAFMVLAHATPEMRREDRFPERLERSLLDLADTAEKKSVHMEPGLRPYEVTVAMSGGITVYATGQYEAMQAVREMPSDRIMEAAAWDCPEPTDAYSNP